MAIHSKAPGTFNIPWPWLSAPVPLMNDAEVSSARRMRCGERRRPRSLHAPTTSASDPHALGELMEVPAKERGA